MNSALDSVSNVWILDFRGERKVETFEFTCMLLFCVRTRANKRIEFDFNDI